METLKSYFDTTLGVDVVIMPLNEERTKGLPFFVKSNYKLFTTQLFGCELILVETKEAISADRLKKQLDIIHADIQLPVIAILKPTEAYNRSRLIQKKVSFVIPGKQMYMPSLLVDLKEFGVSKEQKSEFLQPSVQLLLLYHLQVETLDGLNLKKIAEKLEYNAATITRAMKYLLINDICTLAGTKDKFVQFNFSKKELWTKTEAMMFNPIKKSSYFTGILNDMDLRKTNINALSQYSDLNPSLIHFYAAKPGTIQLLKEEYPNQVGQMDGDVCIEEWKYNPAKLSQTEFVDRLSLYLCFRESKDERIENALEQLTESVW